MRTTIRLDEQLLRDAKLAAAESGRTLTAVIEDALRETLARRPQSGRRERVRLLTVPGPPAPGLDLDNSAALLDFLEGSDAAPGR